MIRSIRRRRILLQSSLAINPQMRTRSASPCDSLLREVLQIALAEHGAGLRGLSGGHVHSTIRSSIRVRIMCLPIHGWQRHRTSQREIAIYICLFAYLHIHPYIHSCIHSYIHDIYSFMPFIHTFVHLFTHAMYSLIHLYIYSSMPFIHPCHLFVHAIYSFMFCVMYLCAYECGISAGRSWLLERALLRWPARRPLSSCFLRRLHLVYSFINLFIHSCMNWALHRWPTRALEAAKWWMRRSALTAVLRWLQNRRCNVNVQDWLTCLEDAL